MTDQTRQKALFLDRDGIINIDHGYVSTVDNFEFSKGIFTLLKLFRDAGYRLFVVTNQSGIGRGYYSEADFQRLTRWMLEQFKTEGITIDQVLYCPHRPDEHCHCRKPDTGMIEEALRTFPLDLPHSWLIGDKSSDIQLATNSGIANTIYIGTKAPPSATLSFDTVDACAHYFQENPGKI